ncbi:Stealth CR1 domain-containing protein [Winogradskyella sp. A3E31]|uniref:Stealth CR1 domain-containing protein n=1 Tax=Winogradskyella sp. A3E31 TaxID=3349637 RepID=UPI00398B33A2
MEKDEDITLDAVITWVDAGDKEWQKRINTYSEKKIDFSKKEQSIRFNSIGEINIAIKSIIKYAPFVKNIYLVTDQQQPDHFESLKQRAESKNIRLKLIDHKVLFRGYENYLPTFNSCTIGSMLFRVPDLSEHFIVFNDDTFLMRETSVSDFFIDGKPIIRGKWKKYNEDRHLRKLYRNFRKLIGIPIKRKTVGFKQFQQTSAKLAGTKNYIRRFHTPVCVRKSTLEKFFDTNPVLEDNIKYRFRNENQFIISSLSEHLEVKNNTYHYSNVDQLTYFRSYKSLSSVKRKLNRFLKQDHKLFMTFQSLELAEDSILEYILNWIDNRLS